MNRELAQQALDLIKDIPVEDFIQCEYTNKVSRCCIVGHINRLTSPNPSDYSGLNCTFPSPNTLLFNQDTFSNDLEIINNGGSLDDYISEGSNPRERGINYFNYIINGNSI